MSFPKDNNQIKKRPWLLPLLIAASLILPIISLNIGFYGISPREVFLFIFKGAGAVADNVAIIIQNIRLPRIIAAFAIGAGLAVSGSAYQSAFKNPLVSENIIGVTQGASLGAALGLLLGLGAFMVQLLAFCGGIVTVTLAFFIGSRARFDRDVSLVLAGSVMSALALSLLTAIKYLADANDTLPSIVYWTMGSLAKVNISSLAFSLIPILFGCILLYLLRWKLNILTLDDENALSLGLNPYLYRLLVVMVATFICSAAICLGGQIGWIGLMLPHLARGLAGADHRKMLPVAALLGGCFLLIVDNLARSLSAMEIPVGALTALFGAPFFIILLVKRKPA
ncbi:MAG: iron ABC transporter permease [Clostridiales bacterium]|nr:iron ABC transporter permease [Clostridiales bacterium]